MTQVGSEPRTFGHPDTAMAFRDLMSDIIKREVLSLVPGVLYGTVLKVEKSGATFSTGEVVGGTLANPVKSTPSEGLPPEEPGNPSQLFYATVRLDNGEIIQARLHENIPFWREATYYDPENPGGTVGSVIIADGIYRYAMLSAIVDDSGITTNRIVPDLTQHMPTFPKVPPRVVIQGGAGKYYVARIMRGLVEFDSPVLKDSYTVNQSRAGWRGEKFEIYGAERTYFQQGWVGDCAFYSKTGYEIELRYGDTTEKIQKYRLTKQALNGMTAGTWTIVLPYMDSWAELDAASAAGVKKNILRACKDAGGAVFFYVQNRDVDNVLLTALDRYEWAGHVTVSSLDSSLSEIPGATLPAGYDTFNWATTGDYLTGTGGLQSLRARYEPYDVVTNHYYKLQHSVTGGGVVSLERDAGNLPRLSWTQRFIPMAGLSQYHQQSYSDITMPTVGTVIPWAGHPPTAGSAKAGRAVTADGVDMSGWCGLYYIMKNTGNQTVDSTCFVYVDYQGYTEIPPNWLLICQTNNDTQSAYARLGTGREIDYWRTPTLATGWGFNAIPCRYKKEDGYVTFKGGFNNTTAATSANPASIANFVPVGFRPDNTRLFGLNLLTSAGAVGTASARVDVTTTGTLTLRGPVLASGQVMMDPIAYHAEA